MSRQGNFIPQMNEENKKEGWISLQRSIRKNWVWKDPEHLRAWIDILLEVNHKPNKVPIKMQMFYVDRGESINSLKTWANRWGWSIGKVRRFLKMLENDTMIAMQTGSETKWKTTHLTVLNYNTYQGERHANETQNDTQTEHKRKPNGNQTETNNKDNNDNKKESLFLISDLPFQTKAFEQSWHDWIAYRKQIKKPMTERGVTRHINLLKEMEEEEALECIDRSISNGWAGLFEIKNQKQKKAMTKKEKEEWNKTL